MRIVGAFQTNTVMKYVPTFKNLILAAAVSLGLSATAFAQDANAVSAPAETRASGLLGKNYVGLEYGYVNLSDTGIDANSYNFEANYNLREGLDGFLGYGYSRTESVAGIHGDASELFLGARSYLTSGRAKGYLELGAGWAWASAAGFSDDSFAWGAGVGAEIEVVSSLTVTPYVRYTDAVNFDSDGTWDFGVKGNYWFTSKLGAQLGFSIDDDRNTVVSAGVNFRY